MSKSLRKNMELHNMIQLHRSGLKSGLNDSILEVIFYFMNKLLRKNGISLQLLYVRFYNMLFVWYSFFLPQNSIYCFYLTWMNNLFHIIINNNLWSCWEILLEGSEKEQIRWWRLKIIQWINKNHNLNHNHRISLIHLRSR